MQQNNHTQTGLREDLYGQVDHIYHGDHGHVQYIRQPTEYNNNFGNQSEHSIGRPNLNEYNNLLPQHTRSTLYEQSRMGTRRYPSDPAENFTRPSSSLSNFTRPSSSLSQNALQSPYSRMQEIHVSPFASGRQTPSSPVAHRQVRYSSPFMGHESPVFSPVHSSTPSRPFSQPAERRMTLLPSAAQNRPETPAALSQPQLRTHASMVRCSGNDRPLQPVYVLSECPDVVDARALMEREVQAKAQASFQRDRAAKEQSQPTDTTFLYRNAPPSASNRGMAAISSLLNGPPSPQSSPRDSPLDLSPLRLSFARQPSYSRASPVRIEEPVPVRPIDGRESSPQVVPAGDMSGGSSPSPSTPSGTQTQHDGSGERAPAIQPRMGAGERQVKSRTKDTAFSDTIHVLSEHVDNEIKRIAAMHRKSLLTKLGSLYNALMHKKAQELHLQGKRLGPCLADCHRAVAEDEDLQEILQNPNSEEAKEALKELKEYREAKFKGARSSAKANDSDVVKTWAKVAATAENLSHRTSAATFGFICSSKAGQNVTRQFFGSGPIEAFLMAKFGMTRAELVESAESYLIYTSAGRTATGLSVKKMRKEIVRTILEGLHELSKNEKLGMEYDHYEVLIVKEYGVKLIGWPDAVNFSSPYDLNASEVIKLYHALHSKECRWKKLEGWEFYTVQKDIEMRIKSGDLAIPERQRRGGKKRAAEDESEDSGGETGQRKRRKRSSKSSRDTGKGKKKETGTRVYGKGKGKGKGKELGAQKERRRQGAGGVTTVSNNSDPEEVAEAGIQKSRPWPRLIHKSSGIQVIGTTIISDDEGEGSNSDGGAEDELDYEDEEDGSVDGLDLPDIAFIDNYYDDDVNYDNDGDDTEGLNYADDLDE
ncbi:hypothetical protein BT96DRAFT_1003584 [Gymnopus androsaceus JB14]|uniref:Uncharacterized protein n=1 Tax=Gymnopus androsaceus JB14 TaxID=1447944 RepID=A0A6A4GVL0_9AGAR|nr:hypothetical protein BT96DRAFT_1003584 [Gymnopus androsaceus JB14]